MKIIDERMNERDSELRLVADSGEVLFTVPYFHSDPDCRVSAEKLIEAWIRNHTPDYICTCGEQFCTGNDLRNHIRLCGECHRQDTGGNII